MDPNNPHEVIFWDNLYKLRPWLSAGRDKNEVIMNVSIFVKVNSQ